MLQIFPELACREPEIKDKNYELIEMALRDSKNSDRLCDFHGVEEDIVRDTADDLARSINMLSKAIGNSKREILFYSSLQGELLTEMKALCVESGVSFASIFGQQIKMSRSHAHLLIKF